MEAVPIFQLLTIAVFFNSMDRVTKWLYVSEGQTQRQFRWSLISAPAGTIGVVIGAKWGAYGIAMGYTITACLLTFPSIIYCLQTSPLKISDFFSAVYPSVFASIPAVAILLASKLVLPTIDNLILNLSVKLAIFTTTYLLF